MFQGIYLKKNHGDFKNIEELFGVADSRLNWFFEKNIKKEQTTRNKLTDVINKRFSNNMEIDFNEIGKEYCKIFSLSNQRYNWFYWIFFAIIIEMYFKNYKSLIDKPRVPLGGSEALPD